jgi:hypothetical protein
MHPNSFHFLSDVHDHHHRFHRFISSIRIHSFTNSFVCLFVCLIIFFNCLFNYLFSCLNCFFVHFFCFHLPLNVSPIHLSMRQCIQTLFIFFLTYMIITIAFAGSIIQLLFIHLLTHLIVYLFV